jgi:thioredoxin reductase
METKDTLPVVVIGAGPIGLAAATHLLSRGLTPVVLEAGPAAGWNVRAWGHVRVFSPWRYLVDPVARRRLEGAGWTMPDEEALPTGAELVQGYLAPLADTLAPHVRYDQRVTSIARAGLDKVKTEGRDGTPFEIVARAGDGEEVRLRARAVIDASGTFTSPNPLGSAGVPADGENALAAHVDYGLPDVRGRGRARYAGRRTLVVGSGHSAFNVLLDLAWLKTEVPETSIRWAIRRQEQGLLFGGGARDALPARGSLGERLRRLIEAGTIALETGFRTTRLTLGADGVRVHDDARVLGPFDRVVAATGFRPDLELSRELRLALDPALESPVALASLIDPNVHSCGTVYPHGYRELRHPEPGFYIAGMKSYGRAPTFLLLTGYEQVRSIAAALAGDLAAAEAVELVLPETGVCASDLVGGACCAPAPTGVGAPIGAATPAAGCGCR